VNHGVAAYGERFLSAVWTFALTSGDWPAVFTRRFLESGDRGLHPHQREPLAQTAREAFARSIGLIDPTDALLFGADYARYEPQTESAFVDLLYRSVFYPEFLAAAAASTIADADALDLLRRAAPLQRPLVERSIAAKEFGPVLRGLALPTPWALLIGICGEDPIAYFLTNEPESVEQVIELHGPPQYLQGPETW
jgi:hypothetical protein